MNQNLREHVIRAYFKSWEINDRDLLAAQLGEQFTYSSQRDDGISRDVYMEKYWPISEQIQAYHLLNLQIDGDIAFVRYDCELKDGTRFRNIEYIHFKDDKIINVEVYFGRNQLSGEA